MPTRRAFRPILFDTLETRAVPSLAAVTFAPAILGQRFTMPPRVVPQGAPSTRAAINDFTARYQQAIQEILLAPSTTDTAARLNAFDTAVREALDDLANDLVEGIDASTDSAEAEQVREAIIGPGPNSLASQLAALAASAVEEGAVASTLLSDAAKLVEQATSNAVESVTEQPTSSFVVQPGIATAETVEFTPTSSTKADASTPRTLADTVRAEFGKFLKEYLQTAREQQKSTSVDGSNASSANSSIWKDRVQDALHDLSARVTDLLSDAGVGVAKVSAVEESLTGSATTSLESRLANLPDPTDAPTRVIRDLTFGSFRAVVAVFESLLSDLTPNLAVAEATP